MKSDAGGNELRVYLTGRAFPSVSVTGTECAQMCEHCKGRFLKGMTDARVTSVSDIADALVAEGATGMLISGGCDADGTVPVMKELEHIRYAVSKGLKINVHTGFIGKEDAERLVAAGVSVFSADVHQDPDVIRDVLHLRVPANAYSELLDNIISAGGTPAVHLTAGLGTRDLILSAELVRSKGLNEVILLALIPVKGTAAGTPVSEDTVLEAVNILTEMGMEVTLGCMRPRIHRDLEIKCIEAGVRRIANPSRSTLIWASEKGMKIIEIPGCCCFIR